MDDNPTTEECAPDTAPASRIDEAIAALADDAGAVFERDVLTMLRKLRVSNPGAFARARAQVKAARNVSIPEFDKLTAAPNAAGESSLYADDEPWPEPVDGAKLLRDIVAAIGRHVAAEQSTIDASALWAMHTHLMDVVQVSPIAHICAPEMRCGKTVLLTTLGKLSFRPLQVANIATAALFRSIAEWSPTLLIDEVDTFLGEHEDARGVINSGFTRDSAYVVRCAGDEHKPTKFSTWGAKALCGIGRIANTIADRSIPLKLRRKKTGESTINIRHSDPELWIQLRSKIARWADDYREVIARARPEPIQGLNDRANDCWEPLLSIVDAIGAEWPKRARLAATALHGLDTDAPTVGTELLADIRNVFGKEKSIFTAGLLANLVAIEDAPWATWAKGNPMTARQLFARLNDYCIRPATIRIEGQTAKGYRLNQFADAFSRYLPREPQPSSVAPSQPSND